MDRSHKRETYMAVSSDFGIPGFIPTGRAEGARDRGGSHDVEPIRSDSGQLSASGQK